MGIWKLFEIIFYFYCRNKKQGFKTLFFMSGEIGILPFGRLSSTTFFPPKADPTWAGKTPYICGGIGIRTLGRLSSTTVFKTAALNRSAIPPHI